MSDHNHFHNPDMEIQMRRALEKLGPANPLTPQPDVSESSRSGTLSLPHLGGGRGQFQNGSDYRPRGRFARDGEVPVSTARGPRHEEGTNRQAMNAMLAAQKTLERERDELRKERDDQKELVNRLRTRVAHAEHALSERDTKIAALSEELAAKTRQLQVANSSIDQLKSRLARAAVRTAPPAPAPLSKPAQVAALRSLSQSVAKPAPTAPEPVSVEDRIAAFGNLADGDEPLSMPDVPMRRRGRPPGQKNKPRTAVVPKPLRINHAAMATGSKAKDSASPISEPVRWWLKK